RSRGLPFLSTAFRAYHCPVPWSETLPQVSLAGTLLTVLLLFFAAFGEPILGRRAYAWLARSRDGDARALSLLYAVTMVIHVLWGLIVLVVLMTSSGLVATDLGLRAPHAFGPVIGGARSEEHTSELQSRFDLVCRLLLAKKNATRTTRPRCATRARATP